MQACARRLGQLASIVCIGVLPLLGACATPANPGAMTAAVAEDTLLVPQSRLRQSVTLGTVGGGRETSPLWTSQVSSDDFAEALRRSLEAHAVLATGAGTYRLEAQLLELKQPWGGIDLEVSATVNYRLVSSQDGKVIFERRIGNAYTARFGESALAVVRLRLANEGAIRDNIQAFLRALVAEERNNPAALNPLVSQLLPQLSAWLSG